MGLRRTSHAVHDICYHLVWCPKYRKAILTGGIAKAFEEALQWRMGALEIQSDHVHLFVSVPSSVAVADAVKILKGTTARLLFQIFPAIKQKLWGARPSPSYYVGTAGNVSAETIKRCIERTEHIRGRG